MKKNIKEIIDNFDKRRIKAIKSIVNANVSRTKFDICLINQIKALAMLYYGERIKSDYYINKANGLIFEFCRQLTEPIIYKTIDLQPVDWCRRINHSGALLALRIYFLYRNRPDILFPETLAKLRDGIEPDGHIEPKESLRRYLAEICYNPDKHIGIHTWKFPWEEAVEYTENHRLQITTHALLLCQMYKNEFYKPPDGQAIPIKCDINNGKSYWEYWKKSFYEYLIGYKKQRYPIEPWQLEDFKHLDWGIIEKDGTLYSQVYLGDFWLLRDLIDDPVISKYCEMLIDLILIDYSEEVIHGVYAGAHENSEHHSLQLPGLMHILNYLLFDNLPFEPVAEDYFEWGSWGYLSLLTSDYNPLHPDFPKVIIDIAINKPLNGYMVKEAVGETSGGLPHKPKATWVMPDHALGFSIQSWVGWGYHAGGAYIATKGNTPQNTGLAVLPFGMDDNNHFDLKYSLVCPFYSVVGKGVAITQCGTKDLPSKIWIKNGFYEDFTSHAPWFFFSATSVLNRKIYLAVRPVFSRFKIDDPRVPGLVISLPAENSPSWANSITPSDVSGKIYRTEDPCDYLIWEISNSDEYSSLSMFMEKINCNFFETNKELITYRSLKNETVSFDRIKSSQHKVNGKIIKYDDFRYVVKNPWGEWPQNTKKAIFQNEDHLTYYNFDPCDNGSFYDNLPSKYFEYKKNNKCKDFLV